MQLNYKVFGEGFPVIILHGLLGSLDNWQTIAKKLAEKFQVFIVDQRNHGRSPHSFEFSYELLSNDLLDFFEQHHINKAHIIGHSMGGKAAMEFALEHSNRVEKLIVADVAPVGYEDRHSDVFSALFAADVKHAASREKVRDVLRQHLKEDETTVQFLMKGLQRSAPRPNAEGGQEGQTGFQWKFNLESLWKNYSRISDAISSAKSFSGKTLFIKGEKSNYLNSDNYSSIGKLFPDNQFTEIKDAGHWVHAEKPVEFLAEVVRFIEND